MTRREQIARIIDPTAFEPMTGHIPHLRQADALAKADQIMALEGDHVHADLCRISRAALGAGSPLDLRDDLDRRANETMKALIASALKGPTHD